MGDCFANETFDSCGEYGRCIENPLNISSRVCDCHLYYDPIHKCTINLFEEPEYDLAVLFYQILGYSFNIFYFFLFFFEVATDVRRKYFSEAAEKAEKNVIFYIKIVAVFYTLVKLTSISLFSWGAANKSTNIVGAQLAIQYAGSSTILVLYMLSVFQWLILILRAKNLGIESRYFKRSTAILATILFLVTVFVGICAVLDKLEIASAITKPSAIYGTAIITGLTCLFNLGCGIYCYAWLRKASQQNKKARSLVILKHKTITIFLTCLMIIVLSIMLPITPNMTVSAVYLFRLYSFLVCEIFVVFFLWLFVQNYIWGHKRGFVGQYLDIWKGKSLSTESGTPQPTKENSSSASTQTKSPRPSNVKSLEVEE